MAAIVDSEKCTGCGVCVEACPTEAIQIRNDLAVVNEEKCIDCGTCEDECAKDAIMLPQ